MGLLPAHVNLLEDAFERSFIKKDTSTMQTTMKQISTKWIVRFSSSSAAASFGLGDNQPSAGRAARVRGIDLLRDPRTNKGSAFTIRERQLLGIHGLLPAAVKTQSQQLKRVMANLKLYDNDLQKYMYLISLQDRNEKLFYRVVTDNVEECMPLIYTPTVGQACQKFGLIFRRPRGLNITIYDKHHIRRILDNWPEEDVRAIVVTDGERILGLGDLGAFGMGIPVGKLSLYTALAGVQPSQCLPVVLDVGTDTYEVRKDPMYSWIRQPRVRGPEYDEFVDLFMRAATEKYGPNTLIQFEDFGNQNAFRFLEKYRHDYCVFNDDIQGTASVAVAGVIAAMRITKTKISDNVFLFQGAGEANIGIANLLANAMVEEGTSREEALTKIFLVDSRGLIVQNRPKGGISGHKAEFAKDMPPIDTLEEAVNHIKPTALIGAAAVANAFTENIIKAMGSFNERPIIFALSNPTSKAECTAEQAYTLTDGRAVFASGSPFDKVTLPDGRVFYPGQGNNSYIFPGVGLATVTCGIKPISDDIFLKAAQALARQVSEKDLGEGRLYPPLNTIRDVSLEIATHVAHYAFETRMASIYPEPENLKEFIRKHMYSTDYDDLIHAPYQWPEVQERDPDLE